MSAYAKPQGKEWLLSFGIPVGFTYMNSGVVVIDLARWQQDAGPPPEPAGQNVQMR